MGTREEVAEHLWRWVYRKSFFPHPATYQDEPEAIKNLYLAEADAILAIFAEERETLMDTVESLETSLRLRSDALERAEAREAKLVEALVELRRFFVSAGDHPFTVHYIDAALASAPVSGEVKITLVDPPVGGFSGGHDERATPKVGSRE